jgi:AraC-like DNA-binding protein
MVTVCTVVPPPERAPLDAAGAGCFSTLHAGSLFEALQTARQRRVDALIVSVHACPPAQLPVVRRFVRDFPAIPAVALVWRHDPDIIDTLLQLGATGIRTAVDCTEPADWRRLRELLAHPASPVAASVLARLLPALGAASEGIRLFFDAVARLAPVLSSAQGLARHLRVRPTTLMSRFRLAGLPSPRRYLVGMRLVHAAWLFRDPGLTVSAVAYRLDFASAQSFGRHLRLELGVTASEFRRRFPFELALERYLALLITPYRRTLRRFVPLARGGSDRNTLT